MVWRVSRLVNMEIWGEWHTLRGLGSLLTLSPYLALCISGYS